MRQETSSWGFVLEIFVARWDFFDRKFRKAWKYFLKKKIFEEIVELENSFLEKKTRISFLLYKEDVKI